MDKPGFPFCVALLVTKDVKSAPLLSTGQAIVTALSGGPGLGSRSAEDRLILRVFPRATPNVQWSKGRVTR